MKRCYGTKKKTRVWPRKGRPAAVSLTQLSRREESLHSVSMKRSERRININGGLMSFPSGNCLLWKTSVCI